MNGGASIRLGALAVTIVGGSPAAASVATVVVATAAAVAIVAIGLGVYRAIRDGARRPAGA